MSIPGITAFAPVVANLIRPFVAPAFSAVGIDPGILGMILCADMGGYQLGLSLAQDKTIGILGGVLIACMFGGTICWTLPLGHSLVNVKYHNYFFRGILLGMLAIPVGSNAPVFSSMNEMNKRSIVINSAWMVTASAMFGSQLGFIMTVGKEYVPVLFVSKMSASILALVFSVWRSRNLS